MTIKLIIFDFDGVLVDSEYITGQVTCAHLAKYGVDTDLDSTLRKYVGMHDSVRRFHLAQNIGEQKVDQFIAETKSLSLEIYKQKLKPLEHVVDTLESLTLPYCIASNSRKSSLDVKLECTKLNRFFKDKDLFVGSMVKNPKPAPDVYLLAANTHGVSAKECLVIEDSVHGINAAIGASMNVLGFTGASHCHENYHQNLLNAGARTVFNDMRELNKLITTF